MNCMFLGGLVKYFLCLNAKYCRIELYCSSKSTWNSISVQKMLTKGGNEYMHKFQCNEELCPLHQSNFILVAFSNIHHKIM